MKDNFNKDIFIENKKLFLLDMDGTIYKDDILFDGVIQLLNKIIEGDGKYVFISNNSSKSTDEYLYKLRDMNIKVERDNFFTSTNATILYLKQFHPNSNVFCMGTNTFIDELKNEKIDVTTNPNDTFDVVLVGYDTELSYNKLKDACIALTKDVVYIATNPDYACPTEFGFVPDCGAICEMLYYSTRKRPKFIGKPSPIMVNYVVENSNYNLNEVVLIGDRLYTDIATGVNANITTICVLTGEATMESIMQAEIKPTYTVNSVKDVYNVINKEQFE